MATGLVNGTDLLLRVGGSDSTESVVAYATTCSLEISMDEIDQTNKDSEGWKEIIGGLRSWNVSTDALYQNEGDGTSALDFKDFWNRVGGPSDGRTPVYIEMAVRNESSAHNNVYYHGKGYVTSLSLTGGTEDQATYSVSITGSGKLEEADTAW